MREATLEESPMNRLRNVKTAALIDGKFVPSISRGRFVTINPANGEKVATIAACDAKAVDKAVKSARKAFEDGHWRSLPPKERKEALFNWGRMKINRVAGIWV